MHLGELHFTDADTASSFCVYGQLYILLRDDLSEEEMLTPMRTFLLQLLEL